MTLFWMVLVMTVCGLATARTGTAMGMQNLTVRAPCQP